MNAQLSKLEMVKTGTVANFRSLSVVNDSVVWVGGSNGTVCKSIDGAKTFECNIIQGNDSTEFRSLYAFNHDTALACNIGSPARIMRTTDGGKNWSVVYENIRKEAFLDGIDFWNELEGICYGDPILGKMLVLRTEDGGLTWRELLGDSKPLLVDGEASFAASGTAIRCYDTSRVVIATGGELSRLLISENKGVGWRTILVPILQGSFSTGMFSVDFRNINEGIIVGGDFKIDSLAEKHVYYTNDGGKSWHFPERATRGYRECVTFIDNSIVVATGPSGFDISNDAGRNWTPLSNEKGFHVVRKARMGNLVVAAGNEGRVMVIKFE